MLVGRNEDATHCFEPPSVIVAVRHKVNSGETRLRLGTTLEAASCISEGFKNSRGAGEGPPWGLHG